MTSDGDGRGSESRVAETNDWNAKIIDEFRGNGGKVGGLFVGAPLALVHHRGRSGGREYVASVMYLTAVLTREEYVPNERIADRSSYGPVFTVDVEAEATGTKLTIGWDASKIMKMLDAVFMHSDKDLDPALAHIKKEVEALP